MPRLLHKDLVGGCWGAPGRYRLATRLEVERGLHCAITHMVLDAQAGVVLAIADDKVEALVAARRALRIALIEERRAALAEAAAAGQDELWPEHALGRRTRRRNLSRRRRQIFEASGGRCFYCRTAITLEDFQEEHQFPRALDGADHVVNLVAACAACNGRKGARTAVEFVAAGS